MGPHRAAIVWTVLAGVIVAGFAVTVLILNSTLYSAAGFTQSYLSALSRHDVAAALDLAGDPAASTTAGTTKPGTALLDPRALGELHDIRLVSDVDRGNGVHTVRFAYTMVGTTGKATASSSTFEVKRDGVRMGLFSGWTFATSPLGTLAITPQNDAGFTVNGLGLSSRAPGAALLQHVLTPGLYTLGNDSALFTATPVFVEVSRIGGAAKATVTVRANPTFVAEVQNSLNAQLKECTTQKVLLPTGCPFGKGNGDRIEGTPTWSIVRNPTVTILPGSTPGSWQVPRASGTAHLVVKVRSIFDGSIKTLDEDVPFTVSYAITFKSNGQLVITGQ
jgi:hypothetical protein